MHFLIVDDEPMNSEILNEFLAPYGECKIAENGEEAILAFANAINEKKPYDLICMDIMMPKIDGQEALQKIRILEDKIGLKKEERVKVIMTTAFSDRTNVIKAMHKGKADQFMVKPINEKVLIDEIKKMGLIMENKE